MDTQGANTPPWASPAMIFPVFSLSLLTFSSHHTLIFAVIVHKEMVFSFRLEVILVILVIYIYIYIWEREILRNWLTIPGICGDGQVQSLCGGPAGWRFREEPMFQFKSKVSLIAQFLFGWGGQAFILFKPSTDWMRPIHMMEGNFYLESTDLNVNFI